jgi:predicted regulator of Ras-like GTPase activity (Roadblock/LC7/MglB family)
MIKKVLGEFLSIEGITTVALIGSDGFVIEFLENSPSDVDALGAFGSSAVRYLCRVCAAMDMGPFQQLVMEYGAGALIITRIPDNEYLAIIADTTTLGRLTYIIPRITTRVTAVM